MLCKRNKQRNWKNNISMGNSTCSSSRKEESKKSYVIQKLFSISSRSFNTPETIRIEEVEGVVVVAALVVIKVVWTRLWRPSGCWQIWASLYSIWEEKTYSWDLWDLLGRPPRSASKYLTELEKPNDNDNREKPVDGDENQSLKDDVTNLWQRLKHHQE